MTDITRMIELNQANPYGGQVLAQVDFKQDYLNPAIEQDNIEHANVATSLVDRLGSSHISEGRAIRQMHKVLLDIDMPVHAEKSTTPGHSHLFIDKEITWEQYLDIIKAFARAGIVEVGYLQACQDRGYSAVRLPWVKKEVGEDEPRAWVNPFEAIVEKASEF